MLGQRARFRVTCAAAAVGVVVTGVAGCGSKDNDSTAPTSTGSTGGSPTAQLQVGDTLNYGSVGTTAELDCADGKSLNVGGSNNTLTVTGTCATVRIGGTDNKITIANVDTDLSIVGFNNTVIYQAGEPTVTDLGSNNTVNKG
ncbi:MAG TPA: DUF3060 domain-containing protein [Mycobacterium sp.]|nr:DUF3060 domain-containing protein [Mycobacterium sp.]